MDLKSLSRAYKIYTVNKKLRKVVVEALKDYGAVLDSNVIANPNSLCLSLRYGKVSTMCRNPDSSFFKEDSGIYLDVQGLFGILQNLPIVRTVTIDGKTIWISEESFQTLKQQLTEN